MSFDDFWKRFVSFGLAFSISLFAAAFFYGTNFGDVFRPESKPAPKIVPLTSNGDGASGGATAPCYTNTGERCFRQKPPETAPSNATGVKVISKPRANYTNEARTNQVQGKVVLRVTFLANGQIGAVSVVSGLPDGLTEAAITAAKGIKFEPAIRGGVPLSVTKPVEYTFTIY
jgi:TonB family protein